ERALACAVQQAQPPTTRYSPLAVRRAGAPPRGAAARCEAGARTASSAGSMADALASSAQRSPAGCVRSQWPTSVLLPAPAKPATTVTGRRGAGSAMSAAPERGHQDHEEGQQ